MDRQAAFWNVRYSGLIGSETVHDYVKYELQRATRKGNGMLGIYIHNCKDKAGNTSTKGSNSFVRSGERKDDKGVVYFQRSLHNADWVNDDELQKHGLMDQAAAKNAGR